LLKPPLYIEVIVRSQESERSYICVRSIGVAPLYEFYIGFWSCSDSVVFISSLYHYFEPQLGSLFIPSLPRHIRT